jgi:uncharacterized protein
MQTETRDASPNPEVLEEMVRRIRATTNPLRIILFGSAARGEMGPHSDLDLLIVVPDGNDCLAIAQTLYSRLRGLGYAKDILVVQQSDLEKHGDNPYLIYHTALTEGKDLYRAAS